MEINRMAALFQKALDYIALNEDGEDLYTALHDHLGMTNKEIEKQGFHLADYHKGFQSNPGYVPNNDYYAIVDTKEVLLELEEFRKKHEHDTGHCHDTYIRMCQAIIAGAFGFTDRVLWTGMLYRNSKVS